MQHFMGRILTIRFTPGEVATVWKCNACFGACIQYPATPDLLLNTSKQFRAVLNLRDSYINIL
jgi:hypothetical protein